MLRTPLADSKPRVLCNFLTTEEDRADDDRRHPDGARDRRAGAAAEAVAQAPSAFRPATPTRRSSRSSRRAGQTVYHPTSTCAIGSVVDPELRVYGVEGLRVADASVMPTITRGKHQRHDDHDRREGRRPDPRPDARPRPQRPERGERLMSTTQSRPSTRPPQRGRLDGQDLSATAGSTRRRRSRSIEPATGEALGTAGVGERRVGRRGREVGGARRSATGRRRRSPSASRSCAAPARAARAPPRRDRRLDGARVRLDPAEGRRRGHRLDRPVRHGRLADLASARAGAAVADPGRARRPRAACRSASSA